LTVAVVLVAVFGLLGLGSSGRLAGPARAAEAVATPAPAVDSINSVLAASYAEGAEVPGLRSRFVKTFAAGRGAFRAEVYGESVNYLDVEGNWQPVDNRIVPALGTGYAFRNAANRFELDLPLSLGISPVRVRDRAGRWLTFRPIDGQAIADVSGQSARYEILPGVSAVYTATGDGVKEDLVLAGPASPSTVSFAVEGSAALSPRATPDGGINFVLPDGEVVFRFAPPSMRDAAGASSDQVSLSLREAAPGWLVTVTADRAWLSAPERMWPVTVDPTTFVGPHEDGADFPSIDCTITATSSGGCSGTTLKVGFDGTAVSRALIRFDTTWLPPSSQVLYAGLSLTLDQAASGSPQVDVYRLNGPDAWTSGVTWSTYDGTNSWTAGSPTVGSSYDRLTVNGSAGSSKVFQITELMDDWVDGTKAQGSSHAANQGIVLRAVNETTNNQVVFRAIETGLSPKVLVTYKPRTGQLRQYTFGDTVNLANGNVFVGATDLAVSGVGLDLAVNRFYNRLDTGFSGAFGPGWTMSPGRDAGLEIYNHGSEDGSVAFYGPSGYAVPFAKRRDGTFRNTLTGVDGRLTYNSTTSEYTVRFNYTGEKYVFNADGLLTKRLDENGNTISYTYNTSGRLTSMTDTIGRSVTVSYGTNNLISSISDWSSPARTWSYTYWSSTNLLKTVTDPESNVTSYEYNGSKDLTKITDGRGNQTRFTYATSSTSETYEKITVRYVTNNTTGAGFDWLYEFCKIDTACPEGDGDGSSRRRTILTDPNSTSSDERRTTFYIDTAGRINEVKDARDKTRKTGFGINSRVENYENANSKITSYQYDDDQTDPDHKLRFITLPAAANHTAATSQLQYHSSRPFQVEHAIDPEGRTIDYGYDSSTGNLTSTSYTPQSGTTETASYTYNSKGLPTQATDYKGNVTTFENDPSGLYGPAGAHLTKIDHPSPLGDETFTYDAVSRLATVTDGKGQKTEYSYDKLDRVTQLTFRKADTTVESTTSYVYDANGNVTSMTDATGTTTYQYDKLDRLTKETLPGSVITDWVYDGINLTSMTRSSETTSYGYDKVNRLTSLTEPSSSVITFGYDDEGNRTRTTFPAGSGLVSTCAYYDPANRLTTIYTRPGDADSCDSTEPGGTHTSGAADITFFKYDYSIDDPLESNPDYRIDTGLRQTVKTKAGDTTTYTYDGLGRLRQAVNVLSSQQWATQYTYDANSNRCASRTLTTTLPSLPTCNPTIDANTTKYTVNAADQLTAIDTQGGTNNQTYDNNGNLVNGARWAYNTQDQAKSYQPAGQSPINMTYRGGGQSDRATAGSTTFTADALGLGREVTGSTTTHYTRTPDGEILGFRRSSSSYYYALDGLGSVAAVVKDDGTTAATYDYDPFGAVRSSTGSLTNSYKWLGSLGVYDDATTSLYKMGTRWYDPSIGRFTQRDPVPGGALNPYDYAAQDPINFTDPSGLWVCRVYASDPRRTGGTIWGIGSQRCKPRLRTQSLQICVQVKVTRQFWFDTWNTLNCTSLGPSGRYKLRSAVFADCKPGKHTYRIVSTGYLFDAPLGSSIARARSANYLVARC
jgi:RHS repeat-associated protein